MPRSRYYDDDSPPRRGGGTRVAEYEEEIDVRTRRGNRERDRRIDFLENDYVRNEAGPLVVREEEVIEERRKGGRARSYSRERGGAPSVTDRTRHRRNSDSYEDETIVSRSRNGDRPHRRERERDHFEEEEIRIRGPRGGEIDIYKEEEDARSRRGGRHVYEEEEEIRIKDQAPSRRRRSSRPAVEREEISEEIIFQPTKRQPAQVVNEEWSYRPKPSPPQVARETEEWVYRPRAPEPQYEEIVIRDREREPERRAPPRNRWEEDITIRERERDGPRGDDYHDREIRISERSRDPPKEPAPTPPRTYYDEEIKITERERDVTRPRQRSAYDEEIRIYERERDTERPPPRPRSTVFDEEIRIREREREVERLPPRPRSTVFDEEIRIRERDREGLRDDFREEDITIRRRDRERERAPPAPRRDVHESELVIRRSSPSPARTERTHRSTRPKEREEERELIIRRDEYDDTRSRRGGEHEEIIIRSKERDSSPESFVPPPPPELPYAPPIHREIITHHRDVYHVPEQQPFRPPAPPSPPKRPQEDEREEIEIRRKGERNGRPYEEDLIIDRRSSSAGPRAPRREQVSEEIDFRRRSDDRREMDLAIVDVPNTERVRVNGNGNSQEITWSRSNGVRRSKAEPAPSQELELRKFVGQRTKEDNMWTEITKDLVVREALEGTGYEFEETEYFFYVMEYLRYEDVLRLVRYSDEIREKRKDRIRQMEWEAKNARPPPKPEALSPPPRAISEREWDEEHERIIEREYFGGPGRSPRAPLAPPVPPSPRRPRSEVRERDIYIRSK